jgi:simple sugar transport system permease protein
MASTVNQGSSPAATAPASAAHRPPRGALRGLLRRPELGALVGTVGVFLFFCVAAGSTFYSSEGIGNWLTPAAELGILAVPVALLMISGEFDLSIGSMITATGMIVAIAVNKYGLSIGVGIILAFAFALAVGFINGMLVVRTGLPSFIVTLAMLFLLAGLTIGLTRVLTGSTIVSLNGTERDSFFSKLLVNKMGDFSREVVWWLVIVGAGTWVLTKTRFGNWIYSTGDNQTAARNMGVKTDQVRIKLFMATAAAACLVSVMQVLTFGSGDVSRGFQREFEAIIAAVIGGCLLTGGYGSVIGAAFGALTFGMATLGITYAGWDSNWFKAFLGAMLLIAVLANNWVRKKALEAR